MRTLRRSLGEVAAGARVGGGGALSIGGARISAVYFRAGYSPDDYPGEAEWRARCALASLGPFCLVLQSRGKHSLSNVYLCHARGLPQRVMHMSPHEQFV